MAKSNLFPTGSISLIKGKCIQLKGDDIDTDRIIPGRFLKCVSFENLGDQVFADDRAEQNGIHPFDKKENKGSSILIVNRNFGCGSSREHAPQALMRWGIRAIIGQSFAEIFYGNCLSLGIPCAKVSDLDFIDLDKSIKINQSKEYEFNIKKNTIKCNQEEWKLLIDKGSREVLINGNWDATSLLVSQKNYLNRIKNTIPYLNHFKYKS